MERMLRDGDYVPDGAGGLETAEGAEEVLARVLFRLTARRGAMPFLPGLGSRLHEVIREKETELSVTDVVWKDTERGAEVTVELNWKGQPLTVTAAV